MEKQKYRCENVQDFSLQFLNLRGGMEGKAPGGFYGTFGKMYVLSMLYSGRLFLSLLPGLFGACI